MLSKDEIIKDLHALVGPELYFVEFFVNGWWVIDSGPHHTKDEAEYEAGLSNKTTRFKFRVAKYVRVEA